MALKFGILATLEANPGSEQALWDFLQAGRDIIQEEHGTATWYAFRMGETTFGIFDSFETEEDRQAHLNGAIPAALAEHGPTLLAKEPDLRMVDLIASK